MITAEKSKKLSDNLGFSLVEILVVMGLMVIVAAAVGSIIQSMSREQKSMEEKMTLLETKNFLSTALMDSSVCLSQLNPGGISADLSSATMTTPSINDFNYNVIRVANVPNAPIIAQVGMDLPGSKLKVQTIKVTNILATGIPGRYQGIVEITPTPDSITRIRKPVSVSLFFNINLPDTSATVASCGSSNAGFAGVPNIISGQTGVYNGTNTKNYPIMVTAHGGKWAGSGDATNPCSLDAISAGVSAGQQTDNNQSAAKYCQISFWVPANSAYKVRSNPYPNGNGSFTVIEYQ